jgi:hypothetical protein
MNFGVSSFAGDLLSVEDALPSYKNLILIWLAGCLIIRLVQVSNNATAV